MFNLGSGASISLTGVTVKSDTSVLTTIKEDKEFGFSVIVCDSGTISL